FSRANREDGRRRQYNLWLLITADFVEALKNDLPWPLSFPVSEKQVQLDNLDLTDGKQIIWRDLPYIDGYILNEDGMVACKISKTMPARRLWDIIMSSTYDYAEPGFILIDKVNEMNNNWFCEKIRATNPCGEQPLPPYGSCLLGSINLTRFVKKPFTNDASFDWDNYRKAIKIFTRMLDNVVEINGLPLPQQREEILTKRRHGMGYLGLGSTVTMMGMKYGDAQSLEFTEEVTKVLAVEGWKAGLALAKEKGPAPIMEQMFTVTGEMLHKRPEMIADGHQVGDRVPGKLLHGKYSRYMQQLAQEEPELAAALVETGARFTHHSSIAPTGTISLSLANNASNGIEPSFAHHYSRNVIRAGKKSKEKIDVFSFELLAYREMINDDAMPYSQDPDKQLPDYFISADDVTPKQHVDIQAAAQKWIDSSISKTANVPTDYPYEDFKSIYEYAYDKGLKGCTTFRFNPEVFQGVLVKESDLENTTYQFTLEDGHVVEFKGNEDVEYDGEIHSAANLFDALKEGYYGKF
ncbi:MAG: adenosylcobalamin-dependent ribonucleoside-diphosphate reductase, partial [Methylobacter sp.]